MEWPFKFWFARQKNKETFMEIFFTLVSFICFLRTFFSWTPIMEKGLGSPGTPGTPSVLLHGCYYNILLLLQNKYVTKFVLELRAFFVDSD